MDNSRNTRNTRPDLSRDDEIDLGPVLNWFSLVLQRIGQAFTFLFRAATTYFWLVLIFIVFGMAASGLLYKALSPVYYSTLVVTSTFMPPHYYHPPVNELNVLLRDRNYEALAGKLKIPVETAEKLKLVHIMPLEIAKDTVLKDLPFRIVVAAYDGAVFEGLTPVIINYMESTPYVKQKREIRARQLRASVEMLERELTQLDSLKKVMEQSFLKERGGAGISFTEAPDPVTVYQHRNHLFQQKQHQETLLATEHNLQLIEPFFERTRPDEPRLLRMLFYGLLGGFVAGIFMAALLYSRKKQLKNIR